MLRLGYVYGPDIGNDRAVIVMATRVVENQPITLRNPRTSGLHLIHQDDIAYIGEILLREGSGVYNLTSHRHISLIDYVETVMKVVGHRTQVIIEDSGGTVTNHYSVQRLFQRHGIQPRVTLEEGIASIIPKIVRTAEQASEVSR